MMAIRKTSPLVPSTPFCEEDTILTWEQTWFISGTIEGCANTAWRVKAPDLETALLTLQVMAMRDFGSDFIRG